MFNYLLAYAIGCAVLVFMITVTKTTMIKFEKFGKN